MCGVPCVLHVWRVEGRVWRVESRVCSQESCVVGKRVVSVESHVMCGV